MFTYQGILSRLRKRHLTQLCVISILLLCLISIHFWQHSYQQRVNAIHDNIFELVSLIGQSEYSGSNGKNAILRQSDVLLTSMRAESSELFNQLLQPLTELRNQISQLDSQAGLTDIHLSVLATLRVLRSETKRYQQETTETIENLTFVISAALVVCVFVFAVSIEQSFHKLMRRYELSVRSIRSRRRKSKRTLLQALATKQRLLSSMRHELRSPVSTVIGCLEMISNTRNTSIQQSYVRRGRVASFQLLREVDALAQLADIDNLRVQVNNQSVNLLNVIDQYASEFSITSRVSNIQVDVDYRPQPETQIIVDAQKLLAILFGLGHLLRNAMVGTSIDLKVELRQEKSGQGRLCLAYVGHKPKLSQRALAQLWREPSRNHLDLNDSTPISRLPLVKRYCQLLDVSVQFESSEERLAIEAEIPVELPAIAPSSEPSNIRLCGVYAVVDDLETSREYLKYVLKLAGATVKSFNSGGALLQSLKRGDHYTGILLDIHMPEVSGIETMSMVKAIYKDNDTPIIMISADVELLNRYMSENAHIEQVFAKPIDPQRLTDTLFRIENHSRVKEQRDLKVLLIEDDEISADFVGEMLKSFGYRVLIANTGEAAKKAIRRHQFDVALIDLNLPDASGYDIAHYFTETLEPSAQPVMIALTGNTLESDKQRSIEAGMKYHLCKPISLAELKKSIDLSVNLKSLVD